MNEKKIKLSNDQQKAMERFETFVDSDACVFILKGYAGTGKTTIVKEMISRLAKKGHACNLLASTGRAAKILSNATSMMTNTVHSLIYKFRDFNQDLDNVVSERTSTGVDSTGQLVLIFDLVPVDSNDKQQYYFVDEASMVSDVNDHCAYQATFGSGRLLTDLLTYDPNGKFVFIGDTCQLPPIRQKESPALSVKYFNDTFGQKAIEATLTQIMRQKRGNDIVVAAQRLRALYQNPQTWKWAKFPVRGFKNVHLMDSPVLIVQKYIEHIKKYGYNNSTLLCFSNRQCDAVTKIVRQVLGLTSDLLQKDDLLLITQNNNTTGLMNGDLVKVCSVQIKEHRAGLTFLSVSVREITTQKEYSTLMIADIIYANQTNLTQTQQKELFVDFAVRMKKRHIKQKTKEFNDNMLIDPYLNALRAVFGFALTCHKAQGGEWDNVFLDIPRNFPLQPKPYVYQWMYTAMTRARKEFYLVDDFYIV